MQVRRGLGAVALALGLATSGCSAAGGESDVDLSGTWLLVSGRTAEGPLAVPPDTHVTLTFDGDGLGGKALCNDYGADYELDGDSLDVPGPGIEQTLMGCGEEPEALETAYLSALVEVDTVALDGDTLTMTGEDVDLVLRLEAPFPRADVVDRWWRLVTWTDGAGVDHGRPGSTGCAPSSGSASAVTPAVASPPAPAAGCWKDDGGCGAGHRPGPAPSGEARAPTG